MDNVNHRVPESARLRCEAIVFASRNRHPRVSVRLPGLHKQVCAPTTPPKGSGRAVLHGLRAQRGAFRSYGVRFFCTVAGPLGRDLGSR
jgi:hypothetical protein